MVLYSWRSGAAPATDQSSAAEAAFARLQSLAGAWEGSSSQGWSGTSQVEVIARGSVVLFRSQTGAHPGETMATAIHRDGDRLLLTHYCVARNQPRLVASEISADGTRLKFTFLDGTNLASRDAGHMDSVVFELHEPDRYRSQWTWYQEGQERWLERIEYRRAGSGGAVE
jgi:hypothetical protein